MYLSRKISKLLEAGINPRIIHGFYSSWFLSAYFYIFFIYESKHFIQKHWWKNGKNNQKSSNIKRSIRIVVASFKIKEVK